MKHRSVLNFSKKNEALFTARIIILKPIPQLLTPKEQISVSISYMSHVLHTVRNISVEYIVL